MHATLSGGTITPENVHSSQHILQSKTNNDPYIVECVVDDIRGEDRIIGGISYKIYAKLMRQQLLRIILRNRHNGLLMIIFLTQQ